MCSSSHSLNVPHVMVYATNNSISSTLSDYFSFRDNRTASFLLLYGFLSLISFPWMCIFIYGENINNLNFLIKYLIKSFNCMHSLLMSLLHLRKGQYRVLSTPKRSHIGFGFLIILAFALSFSSLLIFFGFPSSYFHLLEPSTIYYFFGS